MRESTRVTRLIAATALLGAVLLAGSGCSDSTDSSATYAVTGRVRDVYGNPVRSARVAVEYSLVDEETRGRSADATAPRPETCIRFDLTEAADVTLWITDYSGRSVRTAIDGARPAGTYEECWDGIADDGTALPDGLYYYHLEWGNVSATKAFLLSAACLEMTRTDAYLVLTDADGHYAVGWGLVPVGEPVPELDSAGAVIRERTVSPSVRICAWKDETAGSEPAEISRGHSTAVDVAIQ
ncbi:MAG TPA: FlgD immunoglobulin-like domain containing protein [Acidobacteriota bacterium]|nr:FlgD immunoglobulin-like domain containing protein [Acidobacteriota bacterium]